MKTAVLLFGVISFQTLGNGGIRSLAGVLELWNRWDAPSYVALARDGYSSIGDAASYIVFFPLYPLTVRAVGAIVGDFVIGAIVVSTLASCALALLFYRLVRLDFSEEVARASLLAMLVFPTSYFLHIGYSESLFLALAVGSFLAARTGHWRSAGLLGALASATRLNGILLVPALAVEAFTQRRVLRPAEAVWILAIPIGLLAFLLNNARIMGDPLAFLAIERTHWTQTPTLPWVGLSDAVKAIDWRTPADAATLSIQQLVFAAVGLGGTLAGARVLRPSYSVWMTLGLLLAVSTGFLISVPRYVLMLFPLFILVGRLPVGGARWAAWTTMSIALLALFVGQFTIGRWAF